MESSLRQDGGLLYQRSRLVLTYEEAHSLVAVGANENPTKQETCSLVANESPSRQQSLSTPVICRPQLCEPRGKQGNGTNGCVDACICVHARG